MLFRHYRELATRKEARDWFAVTLEVKKAKVPPQKKNVIPIRRAA